MFRPDPQTVEQIRQQFPVGARVELIHMNDFDPVPTGTKGTVISVNFLGDIEVAWDNGRSLSVVYGVDSCRKISTDMQTSNFVKK